MPTRRHLPLLFWSAGLVFACSGKTSDSSTTPTPPDHRQVGPHPVTVSMEQAAGAPLLVWSPAAVAGPGASLAELTADAERHDIQQQLQAAAPAGCPTQSLASTVDGAPLDGPWPLVAMSHCHECTANSLATIAEHLASWGHVVVAPSHEGNTLYDALDDTGLPLDTDTLAMRGEQLDAAIAAAQDGSLGVEVTDSLMLVGHSFGAVTVGMRTQSSPVPTVFLGAPADNPLLPGVDATSLTAPTTWLLLEEDNSIGVPGNTLIEGNFAAVSGPTRLVRFPEAGHWSVSDIVGMVEATMPGCGEDTRQDGSGETFAYPQPAQARATTASIVATALLDGVDSLDSLDGWQTLVVEAR